MTEMYTTTHAVCDCKIRSHITWLEYLTEKKQEKKLQHSTNKMGIKELLF